MFITMFNLDRTNEEKPRNKRTAKGLILRGDKTRRVRRDNSRWQKNPFDLRHYSEDIDTRNLERRRQRSGTWVDEDEGQPIVKKERRRERTVYVTNGNISREGSIYTSESDEFRPEARTAARLKSVTPVVRPEHFTEKLDEETGLPLVVIKTSEDAWNFCHGRRPVRR